MRLDQDVNKSSVAQDKISINEFIVDNTSSEAEIEVMLNEDKAKPLIQILSDLRVRTANLDNFRDRREILKIFRNQYERTHPLPFVLEENFWINPDLFLNGETLTSLILEDTKSGEAVAHIALAFRENDTHAEILLPAIKNEWRHSIGAIFQKFLDKIKQLSNRRNWTHYVAICVSSDPFYQFIAASYFGCSAAAILPRNNEYNKKDYILILYSPIKISRYNKPLHVSNELVFNFNELLTNIGYVKSKKNVEVTELYKFNECFHSENNILYGVSIVYLNSTLILNKPQPGYFIRQLLNTFKSKPIIRLNPGDINSVKIGNIISSFGYTFCGIDFYNGEIVCLYGTLNKTEICNTVLLGKKSKLLKDTILTHAL